jgi:hypothetical protein
VSVGVRKQVGRFLKLLVKYALTAVLFAWFSLNLLCRSISSKSSLKTRRLVALSRSASAGAFTIYRCFPSTTVSIELFVRTIFLQCFRLKQEAIRAKFDERINVQIFFQEYRLC